MVALALSLFSLLYEVAKPTLHVLGRKPGTEVFRPLSEEQPDDETFPGLLLLHPEGRIFFANAQSISERILQLIEEHQPRVLVLDLSRVVDLEYSALKMLVEAEEQERNRGVDLWLAGLNPTTLSIVRNSSLNATLGRERMFFNVQAAVQHYLEKGVSESR